MAIEQKTELFNCGKIEDSSNPNWKIGKRWNGCHKPECKKTNPTLSFDKNLRPRCSKCNQTFGNIRSNESIDSSFVKMAIDSQLADGWYLQDSIITGVNAVLTFRRSG